MKWQDVGDMPCSVARSMSILGDRWTMLILRNAFMTMRRFDDIQSSLGIPRHILSMRLKKLVEAGVFVKVPYQEAPVRYEYRLTEKGKDLHPVIMVLVAWGDKWLDDGKGAPLVYHHKNCGKAFTPVVCCSECEEPVVSREVIAAIGPGFQSKVG